MYRPTEIGSRVLYLVVKFTSVTGKLVVLELVRYRYQYCDDVRSETSVRAPARPDDLRARERPHSRDAERRSDPTQARAPSVSPRARPRRDRVASSGRAGAPLRCHFVPPAVLNTNKKQSKSAYKHSRVAAHTTHTRARDTDRSTISFIMRYMSPTSGVLTNKQEHACDTVYVE